MENYAISAARLTYRAMLLDRALGLIDSGADERRKIADGLAISMTGAWRIISTLADHGILCESRSGRTHRLALSDDPVFALLDMMPDGIQCSRFGADLRIQSSFRIPPEHALFFDDTLTIALRRLRKAPVRGVIFVADGISADAENTFFSTGIAGLDGLDLSAYAAEILPGAVCAAMSRQACAAGIAGVHGTTVVISERGGDLRSSVFANSTDNVGGGNIGALYTPRGVTAESLVRYARDLSEYTHGLAGAVFAAQSPLSPENVILCISRYSVGDEICRAVTESLMRDFALSRTDIPRLPCLTEADDLTSPARRAIRLLFVADTSQTA